MKNILFSTTRQWNPGDEFILKGILNLFDMLGVDYNPLIFNRNPDISQAYSGINPLRRIQKSFKGKSALNSIIRMGWNDNSFKPEMDYSSIDLVVFAGSPGWYGKELSPLYKAIKKFQIPVAFIGIGSYEKDVSIVREIIHRRGFDHVLSNAQLICVRDQTSKELLKEYQAIQLPCPALLSATTTRKISSVQNLGLIYATYRSVQNQRISPLAYRNLIEIYRTLEENYSSRYEISYVGHYIDEFTDYHKKSGFSSPFYYSYDSASYSDIYKHFDLVIGPRVHGLGLAASLGIPGLHLGHDHRSDTVAGFGAERVDLRELRSDQIRSMIDRAVSTIKERHEAVIKLKQRARDDYLELFIKKLQLV